MKNNKFNQHEWLRNLGATTNEEIESTKELTTEGIVDGILNHVKSILTKANDKQYKAQLQNLADESPAGKKAVNLLLKHMNSGAAAMDAIAKMDKQLGL